MNETHPKRARIATLEVIHSGIRSELQGIEEFDNFQNDNLVSKFEASEKAVRNRDQDDLKWTELRCRLFQDCNGQMNQLLETKRALKDQIDVVNERIKKQQRLLGNLDEFESSLLSLPQTREQAQDEDEEEDNVESLNKKLMKATVNLLEEYFPDADHGFWKLFVKMPDTVECKEPSKMRASVDMLLATGLCKEVDSTRSKLHIIK